MIENFTAFTLGFLSVLHPCPFATNLAMLGLLGTVQLRAGRSVAGIFLFIAGEVCTFVTLATLVAASFLKIALAANFLQQNLPQLLGPVLILAGMFLSGILFSQRALPDLRRFSERWLRRLGLAAPIFLGIFVALSFCPFTAAMFFGVLVPMAVKAEQVTILPFFYGFGAAMPLALIAAAVVVAPQFLPLKADRANFFSQSMQRIVGGALIIAGIAVSLHFIFGLF